MLSVYGVGDGSDTFNLPDYREVALVGVGKNTTNIFDSTETDPSTGQAGTQNHDIYTVGYFGDDCLQNHNHEIMNGHRDNSGAGGNWYADTWNRGSNLYWTKMQEMYASQVTNARVNDVTRGKRKGVTYIIKII